MTRIRSARDVDFGTYFLTDGPVTEALLEAARSGAHVTVTAQRDPYGGDEGDTRPGANDAIAASLREAGATVTLLERETTAYHAKAAVVDGVAYFDDRNWTRSGHEIVVADDAPEDAALVRNAIAGHGGEDATLATRKDAALAREVELIDAARGLPVVVETEVIGDGPLTRALKDHAAGAAATTLIVGHGGRHGAAETKALRELRAHGVRVVTSGSNEKLALAGDEAWIGSANATSIFYTGKDGVRRSTGDQVEWGLRTDAPALVDAVRTALQRDLAAGVRVRAA